MKHTIPYKDPHEDENRFFQNLFLYGVILCSRIKYLTYLATNFGASLRLFSLRLQLQSGVKVVVGMRRERLWDAVICHFKEKRFSVLEFGVAWGYSTNYFLSKSQDILRWYGFDTFEGLPESWRHYRKGHFSNSGEPPSINDSRLIWVKGLIGQEFDYSDQKFRLSCCNIFVMLDVDLFEPTWHILEKVTTHLVSGDLLYFDEPSDIDEGSLLHIFLKFNSTKVRLFAISPCQLILEVTGEHLTFPAFPCTNSRQVNA